MWNSVRTCLCLMCLAVTLPTAEATPIGPSRASVVSSNSNGRTQLPAGATLGPCWVRQAGWSLFAEVIDA